MNVDRVPCTGARCGHGMNADRVLCTGARCNHRMNVDRVLCTGARCGHGMNVQNVPSRSKQLECLLVSSCFIALYSHT
jgi:hypothetical protein